MNILENSIFEKRTAVKSIGLGIFIFLFFALGFLLGGQIGIKSFAQDTNFDMTLMGQVQSTLNEKFVFWKASSTLPTSKELEYGMIKGFVDTYKDPYTVFLPPREAKSFNENVQGSFGGVGMNVGMKEGDVVVIAPLKDSPAMKAGVKAGDIVASVDDVNILGMSSDEAVSLIRGPIGEPVKLGVVHEGDRDITEITIVREEIKIPTIDTEQKNGAFIVQLYNFSAESPELFKDAMVEFVNSGLKNLIIDLRGNPGGYLEASVNMASFFLKEGQVVVSERQGKEEKVINHRSLGITGLPSDIRVVVLVDGGSASASEILAGALKDHGIAKIVGVKSFGKGSVQELISFDDGSSLKVTVAKWFTPNGTSISEHGVTPDHEVAFSTSTPKNADGTLVDIQLNKAIEVVKGRK